MITIEKLTHTIKGHQILNDINLTIPQGKVVSIIGPSGAGKTSLIRCLNLLNQPTAGNIHLDDKVVQFPKVNRRQQAEFRKKTAMVFQNYALFINKTVLENITEGLIVGRGISKAQAIEKASHLLERVGLAEKASAYPSDLSGGQQQRVGISRALALDTDILLFDEPTSPLDPEMVGEILDLIKAIAEENPRIANFLNRVRYNLQLR